MKASSAQKMMTCLLVLFMITFQDNQAITINNKDAHVIQQKLSAQIDIPFERNQFIEELKQIEKERRPADDSRVQMTSEQKAQFFYIDDFFIWLGCKFVTCDKDKPKEEEAQPEEKKEKKETKENSSENKSEKKDEMRQKAAQKAKKIKAGMDKVATEQEGGAESSIAVPAAAAAVPSDPNYDKEFQTKEAEQKEIKEQQYKDSKTITLRPATMPEDKKTEEQIKQESADKVETVIKEKKAAAKQAQDKAKVEAETAENLKRVDRGEQVKPVAEPKQNVVSKVQKAMIKPEVKPTQNKNLPKAEEISKVADQIKNSPKEQSAIKTTTVQQSNDTKSQVEPKNVAKGDKVINLRPAGQ